MTEARVFKIDNTDFRIDQTKSRFKLRRAKNGSATLDAEIHGDESHYETITADEDSPWSWTLYPPHFYLRSFPAKVGKDAGKASAHVTLDDLSEHEAAIYLMEHNDIDNVVITVDGPLFQAKGTVLLLGSPLAFSITFTAKR
jgi:hypothetical protein